jgi:hypothetical protein
MKALSIAGTVCLLTATVGIAVLTRDLHRLLTDAHTANLPAVTQEVNYVLARVESVIDTAESALQAQEANWQKTSLETAHTAQDTRRVVAHVDRILTRINTTTLDGLDAQVKANGDRLQFTLGNLGETATKVGTTADGLTQVTRSLDLRINDPQVDQIIGHFNTISGKLEIIADNSAAMSTDMRLAVHRLAQPPSKWHTFLDASYTGLKFGSLFIP